MSRKKQCTPVPVIERTGTTTSRFHTKFTRQLATLSLALLWLSLLNATTPSYVLSHNSRAETHVLPQCDSTYLFTSDTTSMWQQEIPYWYMMEKMIPIY